MCSESAARCGALLCYNGGMFEGTTTSNRRSEASPCDDGDICGTHCTECVGYRSRAESLRKRMDEQFTRALRLREEIEAAIAAGEVQRARRAAYDLVGIPSSAIAVPQFFRSVADVLHAQYGIVLPRAVQNAVRHVDENAVREWVFLTEVVNALAKDHKAYGDRAEYLYALKHPAIIALMRSGADVSIFPERRTDALKSISVVAPEIGQAVFHVPRDEIHVLQSHAQHIVGAAIPEDREGRVHGRNRRSVIRGVIAVNDANRQAAVYDDRYAQKLAEQTDVHGVRAALAKEAPVKYRLRDMASLRTTSQVQGDMGSVQHLLARYFPNEV